tara:strand:+ start:2477 stop:3073 length:597 start_codon:yes stop_codon:yes gene_type:complete
MERKTDLELITTVKEENCSDCLQELINRHSPLCYDVCKKYSHVFSSSGVRSEDIMLEKDYLIYRSAMSYNPDKKTKFSTWLGNQMRYLCLNSINKNRLIATDDDSINYIINKNNETPEDDPKEKLEYLNNLLSQIKDKRVVRIFELRYSDQSRKKTPWNKVAKKVGVSTQTAINIHNKTVKMLKRKLTSKNNYAMDKI